MHSFSKILLFYDGTSEGGSALLSCAALATAFAAPVDVVVVVDYVGLNAKAGGLLCADAMRTLEQDARSALTEAINQLGAQGVAAQGHIAFGNVADAISRSVALLKSSVVVVGHRARNRTRFARWIGDRSVHSDLAERLPASTLVTVTAR
jgi:hypothetical protein